MRRGSTETHPGQQMLSSDSRMSAESVYLWFPESQFCCDIHSLADANMRARYVLYSFHVRSYILECMFC